MNLSVVNFEPNMTLSSRKKWLFFTKSQNALLLNYMLDFCMVFFFFLWNFVNDETGWLWQEIRITLQEEKKMLL